MFFVFLYLFVFFVSGSYVVKIYAFYFAIPCYFMVFILLNFFVLCFYSSIPFYFVYLFLFEIFCYTLFFYITLFYTFNHIFSVYAFGLLHPFFFCIFPWSIQNKPIRLQNFYFAIRKYFANRIL